MKIETKLLLASLALAAAITAAAPAQNTNSADAHIKSVTAITRVYADGLKTAAVAIQYDKAIRAASLSPSAYTVKTDVEGQKITAVYTSTDGAYFTKSGASGTYVVLELSTGYVIPAHVRKLPAPRAPGAAPPTPPPATTHPELPPNAELITKLGAISWEPAAHPTTLLPSGKGGSGKVVTVTQTGTITATDGTKIAATTSPIGSGFAAGAIRC